MSGLWPPLSARHNMPSRMAVRKSGIVALGRPRVCLTPCRYPRVEFSCCCYSCWRRSLCQSHKQRVARQLGHTADAFKVRLASTRQRNHSRKLLCGELGLLHVLPQPGGTPQLSRSMAQRDGGCRDAVTREWPGLAIIRQRSTSMLSLLRGASSK